MNQKGESYDLALVHKKRWA